LSRGSPRRRAASGFTLVELMISVAISLLVLSGLVSLFVAQTGHRTSIDQTARLLDNGRYAIEVLSDDLRHAGYYGEFDPSGLAAPAVLPDPCATSVADIAAALAVHVQAVNNASPMTRPSCVPEVTSGTDIVIVRRVDPTPVPVASLNGGNTTRFLQASLCETDTETVALATSPGDFTLRKKNCTAGNFADVRAYTTNIYFVAPNNAPADGVSTLKRVELNATGAWTIVALVEGVEAMQVDYGLDTNGDGEPDAWQDCAACTGADWRNAMAARLHLLVRSTDTAWGHVDDKTYTLGTLGTVGPFRDAYKRHVYAEYVRLVNPAGRRESP